MEEKNVLTFSLSPAQLKYKDVLNRDFLELDVYAISDINPNRNRTHFTIEGLQNGMKTFKNKPIVGFFEKGDFGEHDGRMEKDFELDQKYWNTDYGERILGFIRESDTVELVEWKGHTWIHFTCVLCIRYCYKQAKKLLKDRSKKVSVEVTVTKREFDDKGIEHIYDFNLEGVTILGSKHGRPVLEAIPDAHASILERLDEAVLEGQREVLCFAYNDLAGNGGATSKLNIENLNKEEYAVDEKQLSVENAEEKCTTEEECKNTAEKECKNSAGENCNNSAEGEPNAECNGCEGAEKAEAGETCTGNPEAECNSGEGCVNAECNATGPAVGEGANNPECCGAGCGECGGEGEGEAECNATGPAIGEGANTPECCSEGEHGPDCECPECMKKKCAALMAECDELKCKCGELEEKLSAVSDYSVIKDRMEKAEAKLFSIHCEELKNKACEIMKNEKLSDEVYKAIEQKCVDGLYATEEDMEKDVAFEIFKARSNNKPEEYSVGIVAPEIKNTQKKPKDRKERIARYAAGK